MIHTQDADFTLYHGDCIDVLRSMPEASVHCCVTSPPYWGLRDYGAEGQIGLEQTPDEYVARMVDVFREVRRVIRDDGTLWLNLGDSYAANRSYQVSDGKHLSHDFGGSNAAAVPDGLKPKDLVGIPWRVAFALQADGWWLRSDIIWSKPNPMPESVTDRPTKAHEYVFLLTKSARYFFDQEAVREPWTSGRDDMRENGVRTGMAYLQQGPIASNHSKGPDGRRKTGVKGGDGSVQHRNGERWPNENGRNVRSVWDIPTQPYAEAHFATFPQELPRRCIAAGSPADGVVLDPFMGSGTTALVARNLGRRSIGIELNAEYCELAARRLGQQSLLTADYDY